MTKKSLRKTLTVACVTGIMCLIVGCATTIPITYTEPAKLNMSGITKIAIKSNDSSIVNNISQQLNATGIYTVATAAEVAEMDRLLPIMNQQAAAVNVSAAELVAAYKANAVRADSQYGKRVIRISGVVAEIGQSSRGRYFARLSVGNDSVVIYFSPSELARLATLNVGQNITVIGTNNGFNTPDMDDTAEILRLLGAGQRVNILDSTFPVTENPNIIDAILTVNKSSRTQDTSGQQTQRVADGKDAQGRTTYKNVNVTVYERAVTVSLAYNLVRVRDGSTVGSGTKTATSSKSSNTDRSKLTSSSQLEANTINKPLQELSNEIIPVRRTISVSLAKPDDIAKKEMEEAEKKARNKDYANAAAAYAAIYAQHGNFGAGYNQAVLTEALEGTEKAMELLFAVTQKFSDNATARTTLEEMRKRYEANKQAEEQLAR